MSAVFNNILSSFRSATTPSVVMSQLAESAQGNTDTNTVLHSKADNTAFNDEDVSINNDITLSRDRNSTTLNIRTPLKTPALLSCPAFPSPSPSPSPSPNDPSSFNISLVSDTSSEESDISLSLSLSLESSVFPPPQPLPLICGSTSFDRGMHGLGISGLLKKDGSGPFDGLGLISLRPSSWRTSDDIKAPQPRYPDIQYAYDVSLDRDDLSAGTEDTFFGEEAIDQRRGHIGRQSPRLSETFLQETLFTLTDDPFHQQALSSITENGEGGSEVEYTLGLTAGGRRVVPVMPLSPSPARLDSPVTCLATNYRSDEDDDISDDDRAAPDTSCREPTHERKPTLARLTKNHSVGTISSDLKKQKPRPKPLRPLSSSSVLVPRASCSPTSSSPFGYSTEVVQGPRHATRGCSIPLVPRDAMESGPVWRG